MIDDEEYHNRRVGTTLRGKWKIERLLGVGGMAAVYVAVHTIGHRVAIKILHPEVAASPELRARFEQEAHAVNRFAHDGAVTITDTDVAEDGCPFLVMELLDGETLQTILDREKRMPPVEVLRLGDELLDVLAAAHAHGIIHRDIKPDNLFMLKQGRLKVLDFGIARMKEGAPRTLHTKTGMAMGTITYMPPEQVRGEPVDGRADLFAAGATLFRLLTGRRIHQAETQADMLVKMASMPAPPLASVAPEIDLSICQIVDCALAFRRDDRYPDALTMQSDVRAVRAGGTPSFAAARAIPIGIAPTVPSTATPLAQGTIVGMGDDPTVAEPLRPQKPAPAVPHPPTSVLPLAPAAVVPLPTPIVILQQANAAPIDSTAPMTLPGTQAPASARPDPSTWVSGAPPQPEPPYPFTPLVPEAVVQVVPLRSSPPPPKAKNLPIILAIVVAVLLVGGVSLAFGIGYLLGDDPPKESSDAAAPEAVESDAGLADPSPSSTPATIPKTPGKAPPTGRTPPVTSATSTAVPPSTIPTGVVPPIPTSTTGAPPPATTTAVPPANTGKTPPGHDKKKDKK